MNVWWSISTGKTSEKKCVLLPMLLWGIILYTPALTGTVSLQVDKMEYWRSDIITVTISNQGASEISVADMQSFCTITLLERKGSKGWEPLYNCPQARVPRTIFLGVGEQKVVKLPGPARPIGTILRPGVYRVTLAYVPGRIRFEGKVPPGASIVSSSEFLIR